MKKVTPEIYHSKKKPLITKIFDVSTAHVTRKDDQILKKAQDILDPPTLIVYPYEEGYFIYVPIVVKEYVSSMKKEGYSKAMVTLLTRARAHDCTFLRLDCDGMIYEDLPTYDW